MIHLSQLMLNPRSRQVQNDLAAPNELHRTLCRAFTAHQSDEPSQKRALEDARMLFRADEDHGALHLIVQSQTAPDWEYLGEGDFQGYLRAMPRVREWQPRFEAGQALRFRLLANPTWRPSGARGETMQRAGLFREAERLDWLKRQADRCGFELPLLSMCWRDEAFRGKHHPILEFDAPVVTLVDLGGGPITGERRARTWRMPNSRTQFSAARFDGVLQVSDAEKFARAVTHGVGPGKGFGFGLLSLARAM